MHIQRYPKMPQMCTGTAHVHNFLSQFLTETFMYPHWGSTGLHWGSTGVALGCIGLALGCIGAALGCIGVALG